MLSSRDISWGGVLATEACFSFDCMPDACAAAAATQTQDECCADTAPQGPDLAALRREAEAHERRVGRRVAAVYWALLAVAVWAAVVLGGWIVGAGIAFALCLVSLFFQPFIRKTLPLFIP